MQHKYGNNLILHQELEKHFKSIFKDFELYVICFLIYVFDSQMNRQYKMTYTNFSFDTMPTIYSLYFARHTASISFLCAFKLTKISQL